MVSRLLIALCLTTSTLITGCAQPRFRAELFDSSATAPYNAYAVDGAGRISMPLISLIDAYGLTTADLERRIEQRLRGGYLREPRVSVEVEAYRPFFILGEVTNAGQYPYINGMTVQNALAVSGGFGPRAQRDWVDLTRIVNGEPITGAVPITQSILPGDTITVRERFF